jgi:peptidyl-prolyl cis-trans isomerase D
MALKWLRDNLRHLKFILWGVVIVFVLLVFVDWGSGRSGSQGSGSSVIQVGGREISEQEFLQQMRQMDQMFQQRFGDQWSELREQVDLAGQTASVLIQRELMLDEAEKMGLEVSEQELREEILDSPMFKGQDGVFVGPEIYEQLIRRQFQMTPQEFERRFAQDLLAQKVDSVIRHSVYVGDGEAEEAIRRQREFADFDAVMLRYERFLDQVTLDDDELLAYYDEHADDYRRDEERTIRYLVVETARLRRLLPADDAELRAYYDEHQEDFRVGEQARASHILFRVSPGATPKEEAEARATAEGVAKIAKTGADFAQLARQHSDDPGSKDNGGDLGWFGHGQMVKEFEDAVFAAKPGEIVGPIKSQFGFHVIKVDSFRPERVQPFDEVKEQVRFKLLEGRATAEAETRAAALARRLSADPPRTEEQWQAIADEDEAVVLNQSPPFAAGEVVPGTGESVDFSTEVFAAEQGKINGPRAIPRGWMVWQLADVQPEGVRPFEDVRGEVEQKLRQARALDLCQAAADELASQWRDGGDAEALAEEAGSTVVAARDHRRGTAITGIGVSNVVEEKVFAASDGEVIGPVRIGDRGSLVAKVESVRRVEPSEIAKELEATRERLVGERANQLLQSILNERKRDTVVTVDNRFMERFASRG